MYHEGNDTPWTKKCISYKRCTIRLPSVCFTIRNTRAFLVYGTVLNMLPNYQLNILTLAVKFGNILFIGKFVCFVLYFFFNCNIYIYLDRSSYALNYHISYSKVKIYLCNLSCSLYSTWDTFKLYFMKGYGTSPVLLLFRVTEAYTW